MAKKDIIPTKTRIINVGVAATKVSLGIIAAKMLVEPTAAKLNIPHNEIIGDLVVGAGISVLDKSFGVGIAAAGIGNGISKLL